MTVIALKIYGVVGFSNLTISHESFSSNSEFMQFIKSIGKLKMLVYLDMSKNRIETVDMDISGCEGLEDLLLSSNMLQQLPDSIGENIGFYYKCLYTNIILIFGIILLLI